MAFEQLTKDIKAATNTNLVAFGAKEFGTLIRHMRYAKGMAWDALNTENITATVIDELGGVTGENITLPARVLGKTKPREELIRAVIQAIKVEESKG